MRTIHEITSKGNYVYIQMKTEELGRKFLELANKEGYGFGDGKPLSEKEPADLIAIQPDGILSYVGFIGHVAFGSGARKLGDLDNLRVDFEKYLRGDEDYIWHPA